MPLDQKSVHAAIDNFTKNAAAVGTPTSVIYDNVDDASLSIGVVPYISQRVVFSVDKQCELGNVTLRKREGMVVLIIYVRKGAGTGARDDLYNKMVKSFRSQVIGGATFLNPALITSGDTENWNATSYKIPFYFYEP